MKVLVGILNGLAVVVCALLIYGSFLLQPGDGGQPATAGAGPAYRHFLGCWLLYSLICVSTTFAARKSSGILMTGIVAHLILVACVFLDRGSGLSTWLADWAIAVVYALAWFRMYYKLRPPLSKLREAVSP